MGAGTCAYRNFWESGVIEESFETIAGAHGAHCGSFPGSFSVQFSRKTFRKMGSKRVGDFYFDDPIIQFF